MAPARIGPYLFPVPVSAGRWVMSTDERSDAPLPRGLYQEQQGRAEHGQAADAEPETPVYARRSDLPYVHARIIRRDGSGRRTGTDYLMSAERDGPRVLVPARLVRSGEWAGATGITPSADRKTIEAAGTAIFHMVPLDRDYDGEREAVPRCDPDGTVRIPAAETLPAGYLATGPLAPALALARWREVIAPVAAGNPQFALALGAAAISPYLGWLDYADVMAFVLDLSSEPNGGKTTTLRTAGAIWGQVGKGTGVVGPWNMSAQGPGRVLGMLGILPAFFDEQGISGFNPDQWARTILAITDGARRAADRESGLRITLPYTGVVLSAGNAPITAGLGAGRYAGIGPKRVVSLAGPFTGSAEQAESVGPVLRDAYGHPGRAILAAFTGPDVAALRDQAAGLIGTNAGTIGRSAAKNMHLLAAGAAMLDQVLGTGTAIRDSAVRGARDWLAELREPEHDAERMLDLIRDSIAGSPAMWPTQSECRELKLPRPQWTESGIEPGRTELPQHGFNASNFIGVLADDRSWFAIRHTALIGMLAEIGCDLSIALAEADRRGWLDVPPAKRRKRILVTDVRHFGTAHRFALPAIADDEDQDVSPDQPSAPAAPVGLVPSERPEVRLCAGCGGQVPLHSPDCPDLPPLPPEPSDWDDGPEGQPQPAVPAVSEPEPAARADVAEPDARAALAILGAVPAARPEPVPADDVGPWDRDIRAYLADCANSPQLDRRYHPTPDGACKLILHRGKDQDNAIRAAFARLTSSGVAELEQPAPASATLPEVERAEVGPVTPAAEPGRQLPDDAAELAAWSRSARKALAKRMPDATDSDIASALAVFHSVTDGLRWVSYAGQVGQAWFARLAAQHPSIRRPEPLTSDKVREIVTAGPLVQLNYAARPRKAIRAAGSYVTAFDLNGQYAAAAGSAELGDGDPIVISKPRDITGLISSPGYVRLASQLRTGHPAIGTIAAGRWVAMPLVKFLVRDLGLTVSAAEVVFWERKGRRLAVYIDRFRQARELLMSAEQTVPVRIATAMLKDQANSFIGMLKSERYSHGGFYRPDWNHTIVATAEANALRAIAKCSVQPVAKQADTAYWVTAGTVPYVPDGLTVSTQLGKWKLDRHGPVTDELIAAIGNSQPASVRDAVIRINDERLSR